MTNEKIINILWDVCYRGAFHKERAYQDVGNGRQEDVKIVIQKCGGDGIKFTRPHCDLDIDDREPVFFFSA